MKELGLDKEELDYSDASVRSSFWKLIDEAERECGFRCKGEKILIQFYPSKSGGEIFITKLGLLSKSTERSLAASPRVAMLSSELRIYKFDDANSLAAALHISKDSRPEGIRVFSKDTGEYYLIFDERSFSPRASILEFASKIPSELESYIIERTVEVENPYEIHDGYFND